MLKFAQFCNFETALGKISVFENCSSAQSLEIFLTFSKGFRVFEFYNIFSYKERVNFFSISVFLISF